MMLEREGQSGVGGEDFGGHSAMNMVSQIQGRSAKAFVLWLHNDPCRYMVMKAIPMSS